MKKIGRKLPRDLPDGDYVATCDYCGAHRYRSDMIKDRAGFFSCPRHKGRDMVTLSESAAAAAEAVEPVYPHDGGRYQKP